MHTTFSWKTLPPRQPAPTATGIYYFGEQLAEDGHLCPDENAIIFIRAGAFLFHYGNDIYEAQAGQVVFLRKLTLVRYTLQETADANGEGGLLLFILHPQVVQDFIRAANLGRLCGGGAERVISTIPVNGCWPACIPPAHIFGKVNC